MAFVQQISTILPKHTLNQDQFIKVSRRLLKGKVPFLNQALQLFSRAGVAQRHLVRELDEILANPDLSWRSKVFREASIELGSQLLEQIIAKSGTRDFDLIITTSCTGFMIPALDAYLINAFRLKKSTKRLPLTELGCAAGAMALSRAFDYLRAYPDHRVLILSLELPSLTLRDHDLRTANLISAALFGDGGGAVVLSGEPSACRLLATRTLFFYHTLEYMGFNLDETGFKILLDKKIPKLIRGSIYPAVSEFLHDQGFTLSDLKSYAFHPGGRRILDTLAEVFSLDDNALSSSRKVLAEVGNLSSASVLWVLAEELRTNKPGLGLMAAFGPGFNAELLSFMRN